MLEARPFVRLLLALLGGVATLMSFPGYDQWWLAPVGVACLALATTGARARTGLAAGFVMGAAWFGPMFTWASTYAGVLPWLAMTALSAAYPAALGLVLALLQRTRVRPVLGAAAWVVMEWARSVSPFGGFPWGRLAYGQADSPMLGVVSLVGVAGLGLLVALVGGLLAAGLLGLAQGRPARALGAALAVPVLVLAPVLVPRAALDDGGDGVEGEEFVRVAAVQPNVRPEVLETLEAERGESLDRAVATTARLRADLEGEAETDAPELVVWPEGSVDVDPFGAQGSEVQDRLRAEADVLGVPLLAGATSRAQDGAPRNLVLQVQPGQGVTDEYQKLYLAPFGEFIPMRSVLRQLSPWVDRIPDWEAGTGSAVMPVETEGGPLAAGLAICFEIVMDRAVYDLVDDGAQIVVVPSINTWFGPGDQSEQHLAISRVRAVELGRSVVHASNVGASGLILPDGSMRERTTLFTEEVLRDSLPLRDTMTWAPTVGPWIPLVAGFVVVAGLLGRAVRLPR